MNRRSFCALGALAGAGSGPFSHLLLADGADPSARRRRAIHPRLRQLIATPARGLPAVTPTFAAMFTPGRGPAPLVRAETFDDFSAQTQFLASTGYRLSAMTALQSLNRTWFYGAFQIGTGGYYLLRTSDPAAFQQAFTDRQSTYRLVDFDIAWELGQLYYTGYWLEAPNSRQMLLWDVDLKSLNSNSTNLSQQAIASARSRRMESLRRSLEMALRATQVDGGPATKASIGGPMALAVDGAGNVYVADQSNSAIRMLRPVSTQCLVRD